MVRLFRVLLSRARGGAIVAVAATGLLAGPALAAGSSSSSTTKHRGRATGGAAVAANPNYSSGDPFGRKTLKQGMSGGKVTLLQFYLDDVGVSTPVDGQFGSRTRKSVIAFQSATGLMHTGRVAQQTGRAIGGAIKKVEAARPHSKTKIHSNGKASVPANAPAVVKAIVASANRILHTSYCYAGGHGSWKSSCYDCSGSVSFALHGANLLSSPEDSTQLESYGSAGKGHWVTIYADASHTFLVVDGRAFDTADYGGPNKPAGTGPRWRYDPTGNLADGGNYIVRHPPGL